MFLEPASIQTVGITYLSGNGDLLAVLHSRRAGRGVRVVEYDRHASLGDPGSALLVDKLLLICSSELPKTQLFGFFFGKGGESLALN
jgi:hypothetical protein